MGKILDSYRKGITALFDARARLLLGRGKDFSMGAAPEPDFTEHVKALTKVLAPASADSASKGTSTLNLNKAEAILTDKGLIKALYNVSAAETANSNRLQKMCRSAERLTNFTKDNGVLAVRLTSKYEG